MALTSPMEAPISPSVSYSRISEVLAVPNLIQLQLDSYQWLQEAGLKELFEEISPVEDFTHNRFELRFLDYTFQEPKHSEVDCRARDMTLCSPLYARVQLVRKDTGEIKEQSIFMGDIPIMTARGTFIINGAERVVVSQLVRSPGVYFTKSKDPSLDKDLCFAKLIPNRGAWLEFETSGKNVLSVKVDRKRKILVTVLLKALGFLPDERLLQTFEDLERNADIQYIQSTLDREPNITEQSQALVDFYRRLRPGEPPDPETARSLLHTLFFDPRRYDLGKVGRYKLNTRLEYPLPDVEIKRLALLPLPKQAQPKVAAAVGCMTTMFQKGEASSQDLEVILAAQKALADLSRPTQAVGEAMALLTKAVPAAQAMTTRVLTPHDLVAIIRKIIEINNGKDRTDDIDHLGNRRVRAVGELIQNQFRIGLLRMERAIRERMTLVDPEAAAPSNLINIRPIVAAIREFFGGSQLSQFMDQTNPLAELTHKRRLSALGPGGLSRERAGFDVRDVHHSHYGRICPIETPEGPNIGLLGSQATYSRINDYGFMETPYRPVIQEMPTGSLELLGKTLAEDIADSSQGIVARAGDTVTPTLAKALEQTLSRPVRVKPFVSNATRYLSALEEERYIIAQANSRLDDRNQFIEDRVEVRQGERIGLESPDKVDFMDVAPKQIVSVSTALIPFLEHDDANRALMGSNMQRQAVPLLRAQAPLVGTGIEEQVARDSGQLIMADCEGIVVSSSGDQVVVQDSEGKLHTYPLIKFMRTNQGTCFTQNVVIHQGQRVKKGQALADSSSTDHGLLALGQNVLCAFMSWEGCNYEDAIVVSEETVREDKFTSIHIEKHEVEARDTKLGPEEITRDIPNVGEDSLKDLDENGIIRIGAEVNSGDVLVGKITPKGETELTAEEKLLRAIFGEKAREVKDTSLRVPHGERGKVIDVKVFTEKNHPELPPGVNTLVRVWIAQTRKVSEGDKMAGRHGNKGVISRIVPIEDMPFLEDGTPMEILLNPIGVPSRMNLGQVLETHLGWAANNLGFRAVTPVFDGADDMDIEDALGRAWIAMRSGALTYDPETGRQIVHLERASAWLQQHGFDSERVFSHRHPGEARIACLTIWLKEVAEVDPAGLTYDQMVEEARRLHQEQRLAPPIMGKAILLDGRTGQPFDQPVAVGHIYMMKLIHLVEDKVHARSTGPYSLITQQPLGGKAQFGGQRFGEMEVWALEAYSAAYNLQEMLTVKSDDVLGRVKTYESIVKGEDVPPASVPESFHVLLKELQSLGLAVELLREEQPAKMLGEPALDTADAP